MTNGQKLYTCKGKGGRYEILGLATGAGLTRGEDRLVYRDASTGRLFLRTESDFSDRMKRLKGTPPLAEDDQYYPSLAIAMDAAMGLHEIDFPAVDAPTVAGMPERMTGKTLTCYGHNVCLDRCAPAFAELAALRGEVERLRASQRTLAELDSLSLEKCQQENDTLRAKNTELQKALETARIYVDMEGTEEELAQVEAALDDEVPNVPVP